MSSLTLLEGWPHILMFGHPLARIRLVKQTFVASQMSYHLTGGKKGASLNSDQVRLETPGIFHTKGSLLAVQLLVLPYPILSSQIH